MYSVAEPDLLQQVDIDWHEYTEDDWFYFCTEMNYFTIIL